jgi:hypothetical protein
MARFTDKNGYAITQGPCMTNGWVKDAGDALEKEGISRSILSGGSIADAFNPKALEIISKLKK